MKYADTPAGQREAARHEGMFNAIAAQKRADKINPAYDALRAANREREAERAEQYANITRNEGVAEAREAARIHWRNRMAAE